MPIASLQPQPPNRYNRAVDLWKRYRSAASAVRAFAEFQEGRLHALRPADAPATAQVSF